MSRARSLTRASRAASAAGAPVAPRVDVHIGTLVIDGLGPVDAGAIEAAVRVALGQRFADDPRGLSAIGRAGDVPVLDGGSFVLSRAPRLDAIGDGIGRAVHRAVTSSDAPRSPRALRSPPRGGAR